MIINGPFEPRMCPGLTRFSRNCGIDLRMPVKHAFNRPAPHHVVMMGSGENIYYVNTNPSAPRDSYSILFRDEEHFDQIGKGLNNIIARFIFSNRSGYFAICEGTDLMNEIFVGSYALASHRETTEIDIGTMMKGIFIFDASKNIRRIQSSVFSEKIKRYAGSVTIDLMYLKLGLALKKLGCPTDIEVMDYSSPVPEFAHYLSKRGVTTLAELIKYFA
jgi:hypothetical protein